MMFAKIKIYLIIAALGSLLVVGAYWSGNVAGNAAGKAERDISNAKAIAIYHQRETELLAKLNDAGQRIKIVYRDKIKVIEKASGECLDSALPVDIINSVR